MQQSLVGLWSLLSWDKVYADGSQQPYSDEAVAGFIHYGPDGLMALSIFSNQAKRLLTAYAGRYERVGSEVMHLPLAGLSPDGIDRAKKRYLDCSATTLRLSTDFTGGEPPFKHQLMWQKLSS